jgi:hypothetical protein
LNQFQTFDDYIDNLLRVYRARNENDLVTVMTAVQKVLAYTHGLEARVTELEATRIATHTYIENRTDYLGLK